jgi:small subunit ribosomal protein S4
MRKLRKKYERPVRPWESARIAEESTIIKNYGLKNKKELWIAESQLRKYRREARKLLGKEMKRKEEEILGTLKRKGILKPDAKIDDILSLTVDDFLERRLQTRVFRRGLASTIRQARQFIVHGHIAIDGQKVRVPSYLVSMEEEDKIAYYPSSPIANELHPLRKR